jgi:arylsulfatase A-like enzyme
MLRQKGDVRRPHPLIWHYPHYWANRRIREADSTVTHFSAIREGDWKLIYLYEKESCVLYNLAEDRSEQHNLADENPELTSKMCKDLHDLLQKVGAQTPVDKTTGKPVALPHIK